jgi:hypothetical protein
MRSLDVTAPAGTKFLIKMKINREIYADFELFILKNSMPKTKKVKGEKAILRSMKTGQKVV